MSDVHKKIQKSQKGHAIRELFIKIIKNLGIYNMCFFLLMRTGILFI